MTEANFIKKILKFKFTFLWSLIILILLLLPSDNIPDSKFQIPQLDKFVHFTLFFILSIIESIEKKNNSFKLKFVYLLLLSLLFAVFSELSQKIFTSSRNFDVFDIISDLAGIIAGFGIYFIIIKIHQKA